MKYFEGPSDFPCCLSSEFESLELLLEAPEVPDDELAVAGRGGDLVGPVLVAGHDLDGADLVLVGRVEDGVGHLALPGAVLGLEHGLGAELGLALVGLLVLLEPGKLGTKSELETVIFGYCDKRKL